MDILPEYVNIDGEEYFIDTNFRNGIIFEKIAFSDIPIKNKVAQLLPIFYTEQMPRNTTVAMETIIGFYSCGVETKKDTAPQRRKNGNVVLKPKMIYDYFHDAPYIYAAFLGNYGIDLNDIEYLHWWKFHALFRGLPSSAKIVEIMGYRGTDLGRIKSKSEQERIARMKEIYALPQELSFEDKVAMAGMAFGGV
jgi:hypothetical protein